MMRNRTGSCFLPFGRALACLAAQVQRGGREEPSVRKRDVRLIFEALQKLPHTLYCPQLSFVAFDLNSMASSSGTRRADTTSTSGQD